MRAFPEQEIAAVSNRGIGKARVVPSPAAPAGAFARLRSRARSRRPRGSLVRLPFGEGSDPGSSAHAKNDSTFGFSIRCSANETRDRGGPSAATRPLAILRDETRPRLILLSRQYWPRRRRTIQ